MDKTYDPDMKVVSVTDGMWSARMLCDSTNPNGSRLSTMELTYPRIVHAEFMTHRVYSRNSASSRAIPGEKMVERVMENPFIPIHWGKNQSGMQAYEELDFVAAHDCEEDWLLGRDQMVEIVRRQLRRGLHKQIANRLLEPWMWITVIASATNWSNFFSLRCHGAAEPHIRKIAEMAREVYESHDPYALDWDEWHLPITNLEDETLALEDQIKVSVGRCARVSYLTHHGTRDLQADIDLHDRLKTNGHWSPFEHVAQARHPHYTQHGGGGNFGPGWSQYRKRFPNECV